MYLAVTVDGRSAAVEVLSVFRFLVYADDDESY